MSRNKEKAQSSLNRYHALKVKEAGVLESDPSARPKRVQLVDSIPQAERWRKIVISEITRRLARIEDSMINHQQIRDLNDELNKLFREKRAWEYHIKELGGNDYLTYGKNLSSVGTFVPTDSAADVKGYRYFGRAKELPDVKRLLESSNKQANANARANKLVLEERDSERYRRLGPDYYGYEDEIGPSYHKDPTSGISAVKNDSHTLLQFEKRVQERLMSRIKVDSREITTVIGDFEAMVPTNEQVSQWLVERKRQEMMSRLAGMR